MFRLAQAFHADQKTISPMTLQVHLEVNHGDVVTTLLAVWNDQVVQPVIIAIFVVCYRLLNNKYRNPLNQHLL